ncbi:hypothetical protein RBSH_03474 [Rhodopirellula baltica SH28]|uniref:Uncharacterized protein n=2 Tax=Rhodopirellula baltica TaxID=265606 RepID=F2APJ3_RHOBT|nr:hypothetical protein RBWH47_05356 [Rhodopirellula baltica WH47]EKK01235.1 hypothetical protein RBSH_03474 [Rhodopirellula baltica SH28]
MGERPSSTCASRLPQKDDWLIDQRAQVARWSRWHQANRESTPHAGG